LGTNCHESESEKNSNGKDQFPELVNDCKHFRLQALEASKKEHSLTLRMVKEKIISTDELIKKYQQKCVGILWLFRIITNNKYLIYVLLIYFG